MDILTGLKSLWVIENSSMPLGFMIPYLKGLEDLEVDGSFEGLPETITSLASLTRLVWGELEGPICMPLALSCMVSLQHLGFIGPYASYGENEKHLWTDWNRLMMMLKLKPCSPCTPIA